MNEPARLILDNVSAVIAQDTIGRLREEASEGQLVAHGSRENQQSGLLAGKLGHMRLELDCRGIFHKDVIQQTARLNSSQH